MPHAQHTIILHFFVFLHFCYRVYKKLNGEHSCEGITYVDVYSTYDYQTKEDWVDREIDSAINKWN